MTNLSCVTGANGHLGNNLVRTLLVRGERVRASVRNVNNRAPFENLGCEVVYADLARAHETPSGREDVFVRKYDPSGIEQ